ncbi:MAG: helix-turn-helix domain-containing protein [Lachnospiraceae bacterium]
MNFADKLLNLRIQYGYSQEALAEKLNVSRQAISKWELGTTLPETDKVVAISDFFEVSTDYLLKDNIQLNNNESLDRIVLRFLGSAQDMDNISKELVDIMKDGIIDDEEKIRMDAIVDTLDTISSIIEEIKQKMNIGR